MTEKGVLIRPIKKEDNVELAKVMRTSLEEFGEAKPGTVYTDPTTDRLYELFREQGSYYFVAEDKGQVIGGCGIYPTKGLPVKYAELVKLYLRSSYRGKGLGKELMLKCFEKARELGYSHLYLESIPALNKAVHLYEKVGFEKLGHRLGDSGHFSCDLWMIKEL
tara:strand:- start:75680 stop:76171 length:492 start_codon:yes stop_codon:yes gene_type:complete